MNQDSKAPSPAAAQGAASTVAAWNVLRKHWPTSLITIVLALAVTAFYTLGQKKIYEAEATVMFDPNPPRPLGRQVETVVDMGANSFWNNQEYYETQYRLIRSRSIALAVVRELGLHNDSAFLQNLAPDETVAVETTTTPELAAEALRARITVAPVHESRLAVIRFRDADPVRAQRLLTAVVETYVDKNLERAVDSTSAATDWLRNQLDGLRRDLDTSEHALHQYKKDKDILSVAFDDKSSMLLDKMKLLNAEMASASSRLGLVSARDSELQRVPEGDPARIEASELLQSSMMSMLRAEYFSALSEYKAMLDGPRGENHPEVLTAKTRVESTRKAVLREIRNVKRASRRDVSKVAKHVGGLQSDLDRAKKQAHELNLLEIEYNNLRRSKENTEKLYSLVLERTKEADLAQMMRVNNVSIVDSPLEPQGPVSPRVPLNMSMGLFIGFLLGIAAAFLRAMLDRTVKVPADIESELGLTCLGLLPQLSEASRGPSYYARKKRRRQEPTGPPTAPELIVHHEPHSGVAEAARTIRTNLMFMAPDNPHKVLLVTSAGPAEGKTTVACCIAIAMAQAGQSVALIDCDLRRPRLHRVFSRSNNIGVTSALLDEDYDGVAFETEVPDLTVTTAGPIPPNPAELFHTARFERFLEAVCQRYDRVIIDSPPVAAVTDPTILSTLVDATVVVVRAFKTRKELARHAVRSLASVGGNIAGVVLNAVDFSRTEYKGSHYYYYERDGYYASDEDEPQSPTGSRKKRPRTVRQRPDRPSMS